MAKEVRLLCDIRSDMYQIEKILNDPIASKGRLTTLKAVYRKLYAEMVRHPAVKAARAERLSA